MTKPKPAKADKLQQQILDLTDALQRERADTVNLRRQHKEELTSLRTRLKANVVSDLLPVIDNFERAFKHYPLEKKEWDLGDQLHEWIKGVKSIKAQFDKTLAEMGVERIKTVGEHFDPHLHEAVSMEEGDGQHEIITEELQPGYRLGDDVIRHAMVRVKR
jgi:molecular chaperone GrpE